jgi:uncharacterized protein
MSISMYDLTIPVFDRGLTALHGVITKANDHCKAKDIEPPALLNFRLFPDMFPLVWQVRTTCDLAKNGVGRLAGVDTPYMDDNETDFEELLARIAATRDVLKKIHPQQLEDSATRPVSLITGRHELSFPNGKVYLQKFVVPNFYFHLTTAYNILRHNGVVLGKGDFLVDIGGTVTPL